MAEGGDFGYDNPYLDHDIDHDDDDNEQEVNTTQPFQPGVASTPYHGGEQHEMQTMPHEQSGLPDTSYAETPLLDDCFSHEEKQGYIEGARVSIKNSYPKVNFSKLGPISFGKKPDTQGDYVVLGPKGGETPIFKKDGSGFLKSFLVKFKKSLGPEADKF